MYRSEELLNKTLISLAAYLLAASACYLCVGSYSISLGQMLDILSGGGDEASRTVLLSIRLPRLLGAAATGAGLALAGAVTQSIFKNPLVSPDILGVSGGAAFGAALAIGFGLGSAATALSAFGGGVIAVAIAVAISFSSDHGKGSVLTLVLAGMVVSTFFAALVETICVLNPSAEGMPAILFFLFGTLSRIDWSDLSYIVPIVLLFVFLAKRFALTLDVMALGDRSASALGASPAAVRLAAIICVTTVSAVLIAREGLIGWVGLLVPHMARMMAGASHRNLIPACALIGALFVICVDLLCRMLASFEFPIGVATSLVGAPVFVRLLWKDMRRKSIA